ncbi:MAG: DUF2007 domain-containing protein [Saprospiraceae bacterium]
METSLAFMNVSNLKIVTARHILTEAGIESFVINKQDTVYAGILGGVIELYVSKDEIEKAKQLLLENEMLD